MNSHRPMIEARKAAGAAYVEAARAYVEAWCELQAYDGLEAFRNGGVAIGGFGAQPTILGHVEFCREPYVIAANPAGRAETRRDELIRELARPDPEPEPELAQLIPDPQDRQP